MERLKKIKPIIIVVVIVACLGILYGLSRLIVGASYSSAQYVVDKENEHLAKQKMVEAETETEVLATEDVNRNLENINDGVDEYNNRFNPPLGKVNYSNRKIECETVDNNYYKDRIKQLNDNKYVLLKSYYLGNYKEDYEKDSSEFLKNYPNIREMLNSLPDLNKYVMSIDNTCPNDNGESVKEYTIEDLDLGTKGKYSFVQALLIGVIDDRYYVYTRNDKDLNECDKFIIVDTSTLTAYNEGTLSSLLKGLGRVDSLLVYAERVVRIPYDGKEIILTRGY